jgi:tripartite-type tricarboxylate transporter receptor subunit TctC
MNRRDFLAAGAAGVIAGAQGAAQAQVLDGPITVVLPLQAASASDVGLRHFLERLSQRTGTAFVVENVAAAAGLVGLERLARAKPDGRTVAALNNSIVTILPHLQAARMKGDPRHDFVPIAGVANIPTFFAVPASSPVRNVQELVQRAKAGRVTYASGGVGSPQHLATEMFRSYTGAPVEHVPYRGASAAALAVAAGEVDMMSIALSLALPFLEDKRVRLIGFCGTERHAQFRELPTLREQGVKDYDYSSWIALFLHKDAPAPVLQALRKEAQAVAASRDLHVQLIQSGLEPWMRSPEQLARVVDEDHARWKKIIREANIPNA